MLDVPLQPEALDCLLEKLETSEEAQSKPVSLTATEFWQQMKTSTEKFSERDDLEKDGCDFIECAFIFMALLGVPEESIDFVLCLMGISRGNYQEPIVATDEQIAKRLNCSLNTIRKKRNTLLSWMNASTYSIIEIHQREYDHQTGKYKPTQYKLLLVPFVAHFVRRTRIKEFTRKPSNKSLIASVEQEVVQVVREIAKDIPEAKHTFRPTFNNPQQTRLPNTTGKGSLRHAFKHDSEDTGLPLSQRISYAKKEALRLTTQYFDLSFRAGIPVSQAIEDFRGDFEDIIKLYFNENSEPSESDDMPFF